MQMSAPAMLLDSDGYEILLGTSFLVQYLATADFGQGTFTMGHTVPIYNKIGGGLPKGQTTNIIYDDGIIPVHYTKKAVKDRSLPNNISCCRERVMYFVHLEYPETLLTNALYAKILLI